MGFHDCRLGGQLIATFELTVADLLRQHRDQFLGKAAALAGKTRGAVGVFHDDPSFSANLSPHHSPWRLYDHRCVATFIHILRAKKCPDACRGIFQAHPMVKAAYFTTFRLGRTASKWPESGGGTSSPPSPSIDSS